MITDDQLNEKLEAQTAPKVTPEQIEGVIAAMAFWRPYPDQTLTICVLTLKNGFNVVGQSASASMENFDADIGKKLARENAVKQIWQLEGYLLKQWLWQEALNGSAVAPEAIASTEASEVETEAPAVDNANVAESSTSFEGGEALPDESGEAEKEQAA